MFNDQSPDLNQPKSLHVPLCKRALNGWQRKEAMEKALTLLQEISQAHKIDIKSLQHRAVFSHFVKARKEYCKRGRAIGISSTILGKMLHRDHTTVLYHASDRAQQIKRNSRLKREGSAPQQRNMIGQFVSRDEERAL